ncbi:MAG: hypothetical protein GKR99_13565 [Rhodobacteraceae bacterium]|nr:hypothetical protein [Paracoccaceae bacterium]
MGIESINIDQSIQWNGSGTPSGAGIGATIFDLEYGRPVNDNGYWTVGLRHMKLDLTSKFFSSGNGPLHAFEGTEVRIGYEGKQDNAIGGVSLLGGAGLSVLDGVIKTHDTDFWICDDCTPTETTAVGIDARISAAIQTSESGSIVVGYQAQHWKDVTVEISDDSGFGLNLGTSDILVHGPFIGFNTTF